MTRDEVARLRKMRASLLRYALAEVKAQLHSESRLFTTQLERPPNPTKYVVCISLRHGGTLRACRRAVACNVHEAIRRAVALCLDEDRFGGPIVAAEYPGLVLELWIQWERRRIKIVPAYLTWGEYGIELETSAGCTFFLPSVSLLRRIDTPEDLLARLRKKAGIDESSSDERYYRTQWLHFVRVGDRFLEFNRCRRTHTPVLRRQELVASAVLAVKHVMGMQRSDGDFLYLYNAQTAERYSKIAPVRMASCAYALARTSDWLNREIGLKQLATEVRWSAERAVDHVLNSLNLQRTYKISTGGKTCEYERLGIIAMLILAIQRDVLRDSRGTLLRQLLRDLIDCQHPDGWFPEFSSSPSVKGCQWFYPGEALLALAREMVRTRHDELRTSLERAFPYYVALFDNHPNPYFAMWNVKAWATAYEAMPSPQIAKYVCRMFDWLLARQVQNSFHNSRPDFVGGVNFNSDRRSSRQPSFITASFVEAAIFAARIAAAIGDQSRAKAYSISAKRGMKFLLRLQLTADECALLVRPYLALGGFTEDLTCFDVRCDFNSHALTCLASYVESSEMSRKDIKSL